jgi:phage shock protein C
MMTDQYKKLYRSRQQRMIGGVCGGLGEYFGIDPTLMRILFVLATFFGFGSAILIYLILLILVPEEPLASPVSSPEGTQP